MKSSMNLMLGVAAMMMAPAKETSKAGNGGELGAQLQEDASNRRAREFHEHVYRALVAGTSEDQIKAAIESAQDKLKAAWEQEVGPGGDPWPGIEDFEAHELESAKFQMAIKSMGSIFGDLDDDEG